MFKDDVAHAIVDAANAHGIQPATLLALVEVETGGKTFEQDGHTPQFLYERHVAWREASKKGVLAAFRRAGLAIPHWSRSTQYKDQRTSAMRLQLIARARRIDEEVANRSASWGLGQTMGFLAEELGFKTATDMVAHQSTIAGQLECLICELKNKNLIKSLNAHDWRRVARLYNGAGYAANQYDVRLRDAYTRWTRKIDHLSQTPPPEQALARDEIETIQQTLRDLGYHEVGTIDGRWGSRTTGALSAFQAHEGLHVTGHYDEATRAALDAAEIPRPVEKERAEATVDDLREAGSDTIKHSDDLTSLATGKVVAGGTILGGGVAEQSGILDKASDAADKLYTVRNIWDSAHEFLRPVLESPPTIVFGVILIVAGIAVAVIAHRIRQNRLRDHQTGEHAGPGE